MPTDLYNNHPRVRVVCAGSAVAEATAVCSLLAPVPPQLADVDGDFGVLPETSDGLATSLTATLPFQAEAPGPATSSV